jgi:WD40 repeat protein
VRLWNAKTHEHWKTLAATKSEVRSLAFSRATDELAAGLRYGMVRTWRPGDLNKATRFPGGYVEYLHFQAHKADVFAITYSHDGKTLITGNGDWNQPGQANLWNAADGRAIASLATTGEVLSLAASPDGKTIIAGTADKKVFAWDFSKPR